MPAGGGELWWPDDIPELRDNSFGTATVSSDQPIGIVVNDISEKRTIDMSSYVGISQTQPAGVRPRPWIT